MVQQRLRPTGRGGGERKTATEASLNGRKRASPLKLWQKETRVGEGEAGDPIWTRTLWDAGQDEPVPAEEEESSGVAPEAKLQNKTKDCFFFFPVSFLSFFFFFFSSNRFYAALTQIWLNWGIYNLLGCFFQSGTAPLQITQKNPHFDFCF